MKIKWSVSVIINELRKSRRGWTGQDKDLPRVQHAADFIIYSDQSHLVLFSAAMRRSSMLGPFRPRCLSETGTQVWALLEKSIITLASLYVFVIIHDMKLLFTCILSSKVMKKKETYRKRNEDKKFNYIAGASSIAKFIFFFWDIIFVSLCRNWRKTMPNLARKEKRSFWVNDPESKVNFIIILNYWIS